MAEVQECCGVVCESADMESAWKLFAADKKKAFVAVQISPAVRVSIGEKFGMARGEDAMGKLVAILRALGADAVVDTAIAQDAVILMQVKALTQRKEEGATLPLFSCDCPAWRTHVKETYPEIGGALLPSATEICARLLKNHYAKEVGARKVYVIAVEACESKKGTPGADVVLTLEELSKIIECTEVNFRLMQKEPLDAPLGGGSGGAYICAAIGGNAEAIARCLSEDKTRGIIRKLSYSGLYANAERREACVILNGKEWRFAVVSSIAEADALIQDVQSGVSAYDFVEVCARDGGAVAVGLEGVKDATMTKRLRGLGLRYIDGGRAARSSDLNPAAVAAVKQWGAMVRSGEAFAENEPIRDEDLFEPEPEVIEEFAVEPVAEETVVEAVAEEVAPAEEPVAEEAVEEVVSVEEPVAEEVVEEVAPAEETVVEEVAEEVAPVEEPVAEEVVEEVASAEEPVAEEVAVADADDLMAKLEEANSEEAFEEILKRDPYYRRLSSRERRKKKRMNKNK